MIKGQITVEILISLFIVVVAMSAAIMLLFGSQSISLDVELNNQALQKAGEQIENSRALSR